MPLTEKGEKIREKMDEEYGPEKAERVFYASRNKGTITGVDAMSGSLPVATPEATTTTPPVDPVNTAIPPTNPTTPAATPGMDSVRTVRDLARDAGAIQEVNPLADKPMGSVKVTPDAKPGSVRALARAAGAR